MELCSRAASTTCRPTSLPLPTASRRSADSPPFIHPAAVCPPATGYVLAISTLSTRDPHAHILFHLPLDRSTAPISSVPPRLPRASAPNAWVASSTFNAQNHKAAVEVAQSLLLLLPPLSMSRSYSFARPTLLVHSRRLPASPARSISISSVSALARTQVQQLAHPIPNTP